MTGAGETEALARRLECMREDRARLRRRELVQWFNPWRAGVVRQRALAARDILGSHHAGAASLMLLARLARFHKRPPADVVPPASDGVRFAWRAARAPVRSVVGSPSALCAEGDGGATRGLMIGVHRRGAA